MHSGRGTPRCGARRGDAQGRRAAPRRSAPLGSPMEHPAEPRPPSDPLRRTYPRRGPPAAAGLSAGRGGGGGLGPGDGGRRPSGSPGARPRPGARHGAPWELRREVSACGGRGRACSGVPEAKLFASALSAQEHPEPRSQHLLPLLPAPAPLRSPARCRGSAANCRAAAARSPARARRQAGRAGLAVAPPSRPSPHHGALPPSKRTERRGALPTGSLQPARTVRSLCSDAGLTRF